MSMLLNPFRFAAAAGLIYVGSYLAEINGSGGGTRNISLSGNLSGGIASSPSAGDFCMVWYSVPGTADRTARTIINAVGSFTQLMTQYVNSTNDVSVTLGYKFLESPIDYTITLGDPGGTSANMVLVDVWRNVNIANPFDVAYVAAALTNTGRPNPGSITPITSGAQIVVFGANGTTLASSSLAFTSSDLSNFSSIGNTNVTGRGGSSGRGNKAWISGAFDAAQFGGGLAGATDSAIAVALALRPA